MLYKQEQHKKVLYNAMNTDKFCVFKWHVWILDLFTASAFPVDVDVVTVVNT